MKIAQITLAQNPIYTPSAKKKNRNSIAENIRSVGNKNPINRFISHIFKRKKTVIITNKNNINNYSLKQGKANVTLLKLTLHTDNFTDTNLNHTKNIDEFIDILKEKIIYLEYNEKNSSVDERLIARPDNSNMLILNKPNMLILNNNNYIGSGSYGLVYHVGNFVIKIPMDRDHLNYHYAKLDRSRRILTDINQDKDFSRVLTLKNGAQILISKFIDGQSVTGKEAYQFVKSRGRILHDYNVNGNVRKDKQGKLYLIDADLASLPIVARHNSLGSKELYDLFPEHACNCLLWCGAGPEKSS